MHKQLLATHQGMPSWPLSSGKEQEEQLTPPSKLSFCTMSYGLEQPFGHC